MTYLFPILLLAMSIYVFYSAITGKGKLFSMENIKEEYKEKLHKLLRGIYFALGAVMLLMALCNFGQSVLYSNSLINYEATDVYKADFADVIKDGKVEYEGQMYTVDGEHSVEEMDAILRAAMAVHPDKFQSQSSGMSCFGTGTNSNVANYYKAIPVTDSNGKQVYKSTIGSVRSDTDDGSFLSKLYKSVSSKTMSILSYITMGLALAGVVAIFILINKFTDKEKLAKAKARSSAGPAMPSSAFNFDEEEEK